MSLTWRSIQKFEELEPWDGRVTDGSVPAAPKAPWNEVAEAGHGAEAPWSEYPKSGPLVMPDAYGSPAPNWLLVSGKLLLKPVATS